MTSVRTFTILLLSLTIFSCKQSQTKNDNTFTQKTFSKTKAIKGTLHDTITGLFDKALTSDTVEYNNEFGFETYKSFLYFKSGYFMSKTEKNALVVVCPTDTTYTVRLYSIQNNKWNPIDSISDLDAFPTQFDHVFDDYNFDGQTDIYIQVTASNGWSLSRGHLIVINPKTKKFELHNETRDFANMSPDFKTRTIKTELWNGYDMKGRLQLTIFINKWVNGQLKTMSKKIITIETNK